MKPTKTIALTALATILLVACGQGGGDPPAPSPVDTTTSAPPPPPLPVGIQRFAPFEAQRPATAKTRCRVDKINSQPAVPDAVTVGAGSGVLFAGWVSDPARHVPERFTIVLTGESAYSVDAVAGDRRPDVARNLQSEALATSGFNARTDLGEVPPGEYAISMLVNTEGKIASCLTNARLAIVAAPAE